VENIATGSTIVMNREARDIALVAHPEHALMHDAWFYLLLSGVGRVLYSHEMTVLYRQHGRNAVGIVSGRRARLSSRIRRHFQRDAAERHSRQNLEFSELYRSDLRPLAARQLDDFLGSRETTRKRLSYAVRGEARRQSAVESFLMKSLFVLRRI
jgi:hypothetical protein